MEWGSYTWFPLVIIGWTGIACGALSFFFPWRESGTKTISALVLLLSLAISAYGFYLGRLSQWIVPGT